MALIAPQTATVLGPAVTMTAITSSDTFRPHARGVLLYRAEGGNSTLTIVIPGNTDYGVALPDPAIAIGSSGLWIFGTAGFIKYADANGVVTITSSSQATITVGYLIV